MPNTYSLLGVILVAATASGCAEIEQKQALKAYQNAEAYCRNLNSDSRLDVLRGKIHMDSTPPPIQILANTETPTKDEMPAILVYAEKRDQCRGYFDSVLGAPQQPRQAARLANNQSLADLYAGKITYGEYAKQVTEHMSAAQQQASQIAAQDNRDRLQALQVFQQGLYQQQQLNLQQQQQMRSSFTPLPSAINCTTQYIGSQAFTNCH